MTIEANVEPEEDLDAGTPPEGDDPDVDETGTPPEEDPDDSVDPNLQSLREKYPGLSDEEIDKRVRASYWEQTRELGAKSKRERELELENERLKGRLSASSPDDGDEDEPPPPPEIAELDNYINDLNARDAKVGEKQTTLLKNLNTARERVGELKGELKAIKAADPEDHRIVAIEGRIERAEDNVQGIRSRLEDTVDTRKDIARNRSRAHQEKEWLQRVIRDGQARQQQENEELEETLRAIPQIVDEQIMDAISNPENKVPADKALRADLVDTLQTKLTVDMWRAGKDVPFNKMDIPGMIHQHIGKYLKSRGLATKASFGERSKRKAAVAGGTPPRAQKPGETPAKRVSSHGELSDGMLRGRRLLEKSGW